MTAPASSATQQGAAAVSFGGVNAGGGQKISLDFIPDAQGATGGTSLTLSVAAVVD